MWTAHDPAKSSAETVVLVHGLATHKLAMAPLGRYLTRKGFAVINWGYPSITRAIDTHVAGLAGLLDELERSSPGAPYHLVTHSMGSIIARSALVQLERHLETPSAAGPIAAPRIPAAMQRTSDSHLPRHGGDQGTRCLRFQSFVMLGPPNHGSPVARVLAPYLGWLCPPLHQLADHTSSYVNQLASPSSGRLGIVAAESDLVVPLHSTFLASATDHILVPGMHSSILFSRQTAHEVAHFLRQGRFRPEAKRPAPAVPDAPHLRADREPLCLGP